MNNTLIVLLGPTGVGKTDFSISLANTLSCDIISADSRQFYKGMAIGTAVPSADQLASVRHHFVQFLEPEEYYSSSLYERQVLSLLPSFFEKNGIALMTGGSGMYIDAVCKGIDDIPDTDPAVREKYNILFLNEGTEGLRQRLKILDPVHYSNVDLKNHKRIIRALEICESTGKPYSSFLGNELNKRDFNIIKIGLTRPREELYEIINRRVDLMTEAGLESEARQLLPLRELNSLNTVGYKEFFSYFDGRVTRENAIELIKRNTRHYAKRQMTWWARDKAITWFHPLDTKKIEAFISKRILQGTDS